MEAANSIRGDKKKGLGSSRCPTLSGAAARRARRDKSHNP